MKEIRNGIAYFSHYNEAFNTRQSQVPHGTIIETAHGYAIRYCQSCDYYPQRERTA